jgi:periplasmic protein TonB
MNRMGRVRGAEAPQMVGAIKLDAPARPGRTRRGATAMAVAVMLHAAPLLLMLTRPVTPPLVSIPDPMVLVELARPAAPSASLSEEPPGPEQIKSVSPQPRPRHETSPLPLDVPPLIVPVAPLEPVRPDRDPTPQALVPPARPDPPAPRPAGDRPTWEGRVLATLDGRKRFPPGARARRQQGVAYIRFVIDRQGRVLSSTLERSSGYGALDAEAVGLPRRAQPLPQPPDDVPGASIELVAPVEFFLK